MLRDSLPGARVVHLPRLHAKVYCADGQKAIISSGNLTAGGLNLNYECGVLIDESRFVADLEAEILAYASLGAAIDASTLDNYTSVAHDVRAARRAEIDAASASARHRLSTALRTAEDSLIRARLAGGALHTVFARTILFLLEREGPLSTVQMNPMIQQIHPDLCDDSVDRVIDGQRFGKKWKHAVRTAQQQLKKRGEVALIDGRWQLTG